jgi:hypothetical protein
VVAEAEGRRTHHPRLGPERLDPFEGICSGIDQFVARQAPSTHHFQSVPEELLMDPLSRRNVFAFSTAGAVAAVASVADAAGRGCFFLSKHDVRGDAGHDDGVPLSL